MDNTAHQKLFFDYFSRILDCIKIKFSTVQKMKFSIKDFFSKGDKIL